MSASHRSSAALRTAAAALAALALVWTALMWELEPCISMSAYFRYRALENGDLTTAEAFDTASLTLTHAARHLAVPGAELIEAGVLARLAETEEGETGDAKALYERSIRTLENGGQASQDELAVVLNNYAVLLRDAGEVDEAWRASERARAIRSRHDDP